MSERTITPYAAFESDAPQRERETLPPASETHIPGPARTGFESARTEPIDRIDDMGRRIGELSDALLQPDGLLARLIADLDKRNADRHAEVMKAHATVADQVLALTEQVAKLVPEVERHETALRIMPWAAGNGADHG